MTEEEREEEKEPRLILDEEEGYVCIDLDDDDDYDEEIYVHKVGDFIVYEFDVDGSEDFKDKYLKILDKITSDLKKNEGADSSETSSDDEE